LQEKYKQNISKTTIKQSLAKWCNKISIRQEPHHVGHVMMNVASKYLFHSPQYTWWAAGSTRQLGCTEGLMLLHKCCSIMQSQPQDSSPMGAFSSHSLWMKW